MKKIIIHPILFAIFPVFFLYSHNQDMAQFSYILWPVIISAVLAIVFFTILNLIIKNKSKTAVITSLFLVLFFSFGRFLSCLAITNSLIYDYYILLFLWAIILITISLIILTTPKNLNTLTVYLNITAIILIILPLVNIITYQYQTKNIVNNLNITDNKTANALEYYNKKNLPDIYYIVLDGYARADILKEIYNYDNSDFINYLTNKGFYVAHQSRANYPQTYQSISSSLNFKYINYFSEIIGDESDDRKPLREMIKNNKVYNFLKKNGYLFVAFPASWSGVHENLNADIFMRGEMELNEFDNVLINTTPLSMFLGKKMQADAHRKNILYTFDHLSDVAKIDSPTFVYVHLLVPHPPFVFNHDGKTINPKGVIKGLDGSHYFEENPDKEEYKEKYKNQIIFVNKKIKEMINETLNRSDSSPIIILQSDHGPGSMTEWENPEKTNMKERLSILNAYYLPEKGKKLLYGSITPVNTFRIVFNCLFDANLELLKDESYFTTWNHPYQFINVTEKIQSN